MAANPLVPLYGRSALSDLAPSLLASLGLSGYPNLLGIPEAGGVCLLLVDGLGFELVRENRRHAPFLAELLDQGSSLTAGFPSSTAVSIASIGTGKTPGEHGIVGYTMGVPGQDRAMNNLRWALHGAGPHVDLRDVIVPEDLQPDPTAFQRAEDGGVHAFIVGPREHMSSGLTRAALRGAQYRPVFSMGDLAAETVAALRGAGRNFVYSYHPDLDMTGHVRGVDSHAWRLQLGLVDRLVLALAERLPKDSNLFITGDHGMVDVPPDRRIDFDREPALQQGVRLLAGEPRARHVYTRAGAATEVLAAWRERLGDEMWVVGREDAIERGWFGPTVTDAARGRIGDVIAAAHGPVGVVQPSVLSIEAMLIGHHGSLTAGEQLVPLLVVEG
ncbi:MAG TPA: alkaline phosphatase family protein [Candidatus Dormibacteraeota bacterium]|nr:alkaline phosphatase family protein [Candidatus Dormibacteraeota bacterium]